MTRQSIRPTTWELDSLIDELPLLQVLPQELIIEPNLKSIESTSSRCPALLPPELELLAVHSEHPASSGSGIGLQTLAIVYQLNPWF